MQVSARELFERKQRLVKKRKGLLDELAALRLSLLQNDEEPDHFVPAYEEPGRVSKSEYHGLFSHKGFTADGVAQLRQIFRKFDADQDGCLDLTEFRGYLSALQRLDVFEPAAIGSTEAFEAYMYDMYNTADGLLTFGGFVAYRHATEYDYPLVDDLVALGFSYVTEVNQRHRQAARAFDFLDGGIGRLAATDFQLLLYSVGLILTKHEVEELVEMQAVRNVVMSNVRTRYAKKRFYAFEQISKVDANEPDFVYKDAFVAWWMSGQVTPVLLQGWQSRLLGFCLRTQLGLREIISAGARAKALLLRSADSGMLEDVAEDKDLAACDYSIEIGEFAGEQMSADITLAVVEEAPEAIKQMDFGDAEAQTYMYIDLTPRATAPADEVVVAADQIKNIIELHFRKHIEAFPGIMSWQVARCQSEFDDSVVIRLAFFFNEAVDPGVAMRTSGLPVGPEDLFKEVSVNLRFGLGLLDMFESSRTNLEESFSFQGTIHALLSKKVTARIIEEAFIGEDDKFEMLRQEKEVRQRRSNAPLEQEDLDTGEAYWANDLEANDQELRKSFRSAVLSFCRSLKYTKSLSLEWAFDSLLHAVTRTKFVSQFLLGKAHEHWHQICSEEGKLAKLFLGVMAEVKADWISLRDEVEAVIAEEERRKKELEDEVARNTTSQVERMRERLKNIETAAAGGRETDLSESEKLFLAKKAFVEFYKSQWRSVLGIHSVCCHAGKVRFRATFQALDLMELAVPADAGKRQQPVTQLA